MRVDRKINDDGDYGQRQAFRQYVPKDYLSRAEMNNPLEMRRQQRWHADSPSAYDYVESRDDIPQRRQSQRTMFIPTTPSTRGPRKDSLYHATDISLDSEKVDSMIQEVLQQNHSSVSKTERLHQRNRQLQHEQKRQNGRLSSSSRQEHSYLGYISGKPSKRFESSLHAEQRSISPISSRSDFDNNAYAKYHRHPQSRMNRRDTDKMPPNVPKTSDVPIRTSKIPGGTAYLRSATIHQPHENMYQDQRTHHHSLPPHDWQEGAVNSSRTPRNSLSNFRVRREDEYAMTSSYYNQLGSPDSQYSHFVPTLPPIQQEVVDDKKKGNFERMYQSPEYKKSLNRILERRIQEKMNDLSKNKDSIFHQNTSSFDDQHLVLRQSASSLDDSTKSGDERRSSQHVKTILETQDIAKGNDTIMSFDIVQSGDRIKVRPSTALSTSTGITSSRDKRKSKKNTSSMSTGDIDGKTKLRGRHRSFQIKDVKKIAKQVKEERTKSKRKKEQFDKYGIEEESTIDSEMEDKNSNDSWDTQSSESKRIVKPRSPSKSKRRTKNKMKKKKSTKTTYEVSGEEEVSDTDYSEGSWQDDTTSKSKHKTKHKMKKKKSKKTTYEVSGEEEVSDTDYSEGSWQDDTRKAQNSHHKGKDKGRRGSKAHHLPNEKEAEWHGSSFGDREVKVFSQSDYKAESQTSVRSKWRDEDTLLVPIGDHICEAALIALATVSLAEDNFVINTDVAMRTVSSIIGANKDEELYLKTKQVFFQPVSYALTRSEGFLALSIEVVQEKIRNFLVENDNNTPFRRKGQLTEIEFWSLCCILATKAVMKSASENKMELAYAAAEAVLFSINVDNGSSTCWTGTAGSRLKDVGREVSRVLKSISGGTKSIQSLAEATIINEGSKRLAQEKDLQESSSSGQRHHHEKRRQMSGDFVFERESHSPINKEDDYDLLEKQFRASLQRKKEYME